MLKVTESNSNFRTPRCPVPGRAAELKGVFFQESHQDFEWPTVLYPDVDSAWGGGGDCPRSHRGNEKPGS